MTTVIIDYPTDFVFRTKKTFINDDERTQYLRRVLRRNNIDSPSHEYNDYVVEDVTELPDNHEFWVIGS